MRKEYPTVFISYSWDSEEHENWVAFLAAKLRENGVDATIDKFETQSKTVNLNRMMIEKI
ncbi:TIR domain-containing protein [Tepidanaerobacter sp. GT38]|uniref:SEFIR domain-containing protein n=1 Tax=Tepidanaerobacter sp. GT38 TaxID=2722793 RepID=UPI001EFF9EA6|nr:SEFIR domain-containing protein [Tepidanaerobacter sp. GT38]MCG1012151.1 TIR domain-containing protein [Tepidanaerobacter sp. GT38]